MRLIPRRKRTWRLVLLSVVRVCALALWWFATAQSEFERKFDQIRVGTTFQEAKGSLDPDDLVVEQKWFTGLRITGSRCKRTNNGEWINWSGVYVLSHPLFGMLGGRGTCSTSISKFGQRDRA